MLVRRLIFGFAALTLLLAGCGDDDTDTSGDATAGDDDDTDTSAVDDSGADGTTDDATAGDDDDAGDSVDELVEGLEDQQASQGGGSATLTVGDMTYTFDSVLCAFGEDQIGQAGAVFNLSSIQDGMQMYASIDSFGHSVSLDDIVDFENPSVSLSARGDTEFITLDGKSVSAEADFFDDTSDSFEPIPGTFTATCP